MESLDIPYNICYGCLEPVRDNECPRCLQKGKKREKSSLFMRAGSILNNKYLIGEVLGSGGFGITYISLDLGKKYKIAVKEYFPKTLISRSKNGYSIIPPATNEEESDFNYGLEQFYKEAGNLISLKGIPGVVNVLDYFKTNNTAYIVMEYIQGKTLKEYMYEKGGKLKVDEAVNIFVQLMDTLKIIHDKDILHRDISPDNIILTTQNKPKLIDFGAARQFSHFYSEKSFSVILKLDYAPIEQYSKKSFQGPWTDIYALGATFYHVITGFPPVQATERINFDNSENIITDTLIPPRKYNTSLTENQELVILKSLAFKQNQRYQNISDLKNSMVSAFIKQNKTDISKAEQIINDKYIYNWRKGTGIFFLCLGIVFLYLSTLHSTPRSFVYSLIFIFWGLFYLFTSGKKNLPPSIPEKAETEPKTVPLILGIKGSFSGAEIELSNQPVNIGRDPRLCNLVFPSQEKRIGRRHCSVWYDFDKKTFFIEDNYSTNGTFINENLRVNPSVLYELTPGDKFYLADPSNLFEVNIARI